MNKLNNGIISREFNRADGFGYVIEDGAVDDEMVQCKFRPISGDDYCEFPSGKKVTYNTHEVNGQVEAINIKAR